MKYKSMIAILATFILVFSMTLGFYGSVLAGDSPGLCQCCEQDGVSGVLFNGGCNCHSCGWGPIVINPYNCTLDCGVGQ